MRGGAPRIDISAPPRYNGGMEERYSRQEIAGELERQLRALLRP